MRFVIGEYPYHHIDYSLPRFISETRRRELRRERIKSVSVHSLLFVLTVISTYLMGGVWYALPVIVILFSHEMGHYLMCRRYRVPATFPFFIPFPFLNPFGTLGAVIRIRGIIPSRKALFDIGVAGPLAGLAFTLPALYFGISMSDIVPATENTDAAFYLGESLLYKGISYLTLGPISDGYDVMLHPLAYAGWVGLFVTALNLLPIGQLDGGHVYYSLFGRRGKAGSMIFLAALGVAVINYPGWGLLFLILLIWGRKHPPPADDSTPIDLKRRLIAGFVFIIFILSFIPEPFKLG
ncbi:MAG: site-2 protease family protein [candidate division KSB1 bacterium]|nr:site-2 protease family protein [candidate division KSB1 bacterium]